MATEIIVIIEDQDACVSSRALAEKMRGSQSADPGADHHQIVGLAGVFRGTGGVPFLPITQTMRGCEAAIMVAAHAGERRWVVARRFFRSVLACQLGSQQGRADSGAANRQRSAVQEISPRNRAMHPEFAIPFFLAHIPLTLSVFARSVPRNFRSDCANRPRLRCT